MRLVVLMAVASALTAAPAAAQTPIAGGEGGRADTPEQFDTRIGFQVTGEATTPTPTPTASATATASAVPESGGRDDGSGLPVGAIVVGLAVGLVVGFGGRRALSRR